MALIKCPECEKEISDTSKKCINCGYKLTKKKTSLKENVKEEKKADKEGKKEEKQLVETKNNKKIIIILIVCVVLLVGVFTTYIVVDKINDSKNEESNSSINSSTGTNPSAGSDKEYVPSELEKKITSSGAATKYGDFVLFAKNDNEVPVDMDIEVEFYDKDGKLVGSREESIYGVAAKTEIAKSIWMYQIPKSFASYEIYIDVEQSDHNIYIDQIELNHNATKESITVQVKNNSEDEIGTISVAVVYYKGKEIVGVEEAEESDVKSGRNANFQVGYPYDDDWDKVKFDTYKVFVNQAYTYEW